MIETFEAETQPGCIGPAPKRILSDKERRAEAGTVAQKKVRR